MEIIYENNLIVFKSELTNDLTIALNDKQIKGFYIFLLHIYICFISDLYLIDI